MRNALRAVIGWIATIIPGCLAYGLTNVMTALAPGRSCSSSARAKQDSCHFVFHCRLPCPSKAVLDVCNHIITVMNIVICMSATSKDLQDSDTHVSQRCGPAQHCTFTHSTAFAVCLVHTVVVGSVPVIKPLRVFKAWPL